MEYPFLRPEEIPEDLWEVRAILSAHFPEIFRGKEVRVMRGKMRVDVVGNEILISYPEMPDQKEFFWLLERAGRKIATRKWGESRFFISRIARFSEGTFYEKCPF